MMFDPCDFVKHALNRSKEIISSLEILFIKINIIEIIERKSLSILKIMVIMLLIYFLITVIPWIFDKEDGIVVQPFETVGFGENLDGKPLAILLVHDLQRIKDIYEPAQNATANSKTEGGNMIIPRPFGEFFVNFNNIYFNMAEDTRDNSLSQVVISAPMGTSVSIVSLLYPLKEFLGNTANTITCSLQRYNSSIVAVAILREHQSSQNYHSEHYANISNIEQIPSLIDDLAFKIYLELVKRTTQNEDLYPQSWLTFKYVTKGREALNNYVSMKDICYQDKISYLDNGRNMALSAIEFEPGYEKSFELLSVLGFAYLEVGEYDDALKIFKNIYRFKPFESALGLGLVYARQGRYAEALSAFDYALQQDSREAYAVWNYKGIILSKQRNHIDAAKAFKNATALNPEYGIAWRYLGDSLYYLGDNNKSAYDEAVWAYEKAIKLNSKDEIAWKKKGIVLHLQGKYDEAIGAYEETIKLNSSNDAAWRLMAESLNKTGKYDEAHTAYNTYLQIKSNQSRKMPTWLLAD